jgi:hypothetical protein
LPNASAKVRLLRDTIVVVFTTFNFAPQLFDEFVLLTGKNGIQRAPYEIFHEWHVLLDG